MTTLVAPVQKERLLTFMELLRSRSEEDTLGFFYDHATTISEQAHYDFNKAAQVLCGNLSAGLRDKGAKAKVASSVYDYAIKQAKKYKNEAIALHHSGFEKPRDILKIIAPEGHKDHHTEYKVALEFGYCSTNVETGYPGQSSEELPHMFMARQTQVMADATGLSPALVLDILYNSLSNEVGNENKRKGAFRAGKELGQIDYAKRLASVELGLGDPVHQSRHAFLFHLQ